MILDVMLPELNGFEVLRRLRKSSKMPVIMLTARDAVMDKVAGLDGGADDYMTKPFAIEELLARIRLALKKKSENHSTQPEGLCCGCLTLDPKRYEVHYGEELVELTHREFELLRVLLENKNIVISRETLLEKVCGYDYMGETNLIDVYIRYLRSKLDDRFGVKLSRQSGVWDIVLRTFDDCCRRDGIFVSEKICPNGEKVRWTTRTKMVRKPVV